MKLPAGTVTFLFTDIEGSTKLWEAQPEAMRVAVERHDVLMRHAVEENGGYLFKTNGDGIAAAFALAADGLAAALAAQQTLTTEPWPDAAVLRSRMGLHTGAAELRDGDYFGATLSRAARLMAAGHGGQILLSDAMYELCRGSEPSDVSILKLGAYRLRDLAQPENVFQLAHPQIQANFPRLRTLQFTPNNLPQAVTSFIGRENELAGITERFGSTRLLTLIGAGGSGKSRLSLKAAESLIERFPDGVFLWSSPRLAIRLLSPKRRRQPFPFLRNPASPLSRP